MPPQKNKRKSVPNSSTATGEFNPNDTAFFEALMRDPDKKKLVLQLLSQEKDTIAEYKRNADVNKGGGASTPLKRVKQKDVCESPTSLMRRRALEKQINNHTPVEPDATSVRSRSSDSADSVCASPSPVSFEHLLNGVVAYVEIRSKDADRSAGAKALMKSMGAAVMDTFTADVTHVIFKDGSFTTYQTAKLMKVHMVSVLWLEAVRRSLTRVPEKNYPALGTEMFDNNVSNICSQLQKEYEEVVREDVRRSLAMGTPLPSTKSLLSSSSRRRTMMTPFSSSQYFSQKFRLSQELQSTQDVEVDDILSNKQKVLKTIFEGNGTPSHGSSILASPSPDITDDESNCGVIDGDYATHKRQTDKIIFETPEHLDNDCIMRPIENLPHPKASETCLSVTDMITTPIHRKTDESASSSNSKSLIGGLKIQSKEKGVEIIANISTYSEKQSIGINKENYVSSDKSTNISNGDTAHALTDCRQCSTDLSKDSSATNLSKLHVSSNSLDKKKTYVTRASRSTETRSSSGTNMSLLHISSSLQKEVITRKGVDSNESGTNMSSLRYSSGSDKFKRKTVSSIDSNMSSLRMSSSSSQNKINDKSESMDKPVNNRRHSKKNSTGTSMSSLQISDTSTVPSIEGGLTNTNQVSDKVVETCNTMSSLSISVEKHATLPEDVLTKQPMATDSHSRTQNIHTDNGGNISKTQPHTILDDSSEVRNNDIRPDDNVTRRTRRRLFPRQNTDFSSGESESKANKNDLEAPKMTNTCSDKGSADSSDASCSESSREKGKRLRKLYNPNQSIEINTQQCDEEERKLKRRNVQKKLQNDFLDPNVVELVPIVLKTRGKRSQVKKTANINISSSSDDNSPAKVTKKKTRGRKADKTQQRYSSADEQKELANEFVIKVKRLATQNKVNDEASEGKQKFDNFKTPTKKKRTNKAAPYSTKTRTSSRISQQYNCTPLPIVPTHNRRSSLEFQPFTPMSSTKKKTTAAKLPSIVCTKFHKDDCVVFSQIVRKLGHFIVEDEISDRTTHLVAGEAKRTINMLRAVARGCWILKHEWLLGSLEQGKWLPEEDYEVTDFSPAVQQCRLQRQAFGPSYSMDIFEGCEPIYIARSSIPRCSDLQELVALCKGTITTIMRNAKIVVGEYIASPDVVCVTEAWILDCITFNRKKSMKKYLMKDFKS